MTLVTKGFNVVELSSHGDCTIIIGSAPKTKVLKVSSHTLRDISSVFDERLGKSDQPQKTFSLELPTDDPDAIETILRIAHAKWQHTVEDPSKPLEELLQLVHVVDKYKVRLPLRQKFLDSWVRGAISGGYTEIGWSHVAWGFGYQEIYANVATTLILNTKISEGALATDAGPIHPGDLPEEMMRSITKTRELALSHILQTAYAIYTSSIIPGLCKRNDAHTADCNALACGSLLKSFVQLGLWELAFFPIGGPRVHDCMTVQELRASLSKVKIISYRGRKRSHAECPKTLEMNEKGRIVFGRNFIQCYSRTYYAYE